MSISSINNSSLYYSYLVNNNDNKNDASETADAMLGRAGSTKNSAYSAYGSNMYSGAGQNAMQKAIAAIQEENGDSKVTFSMIKDYRDKLEKEFETTIQAGLALLGFEETEDFQMVAGSDGTIKVLSDDPEVKAAVEFMMEESPKLSEHFLYIQALGNIERAQGSISAKAQMQNTQASLAADAVNILLNGANLLDQLSSLGVGYSSLTANYSESQIQYILGANYTV